MVKVFRTDVIDTAIADTILSCLYFSFPDNLFDFYLDNEHRILRVEGNEIKSADIIWYLTEFGHMGTELY